MGGIKCSQGSPEVHCPPITDSIMLIIRQSLDLNSHDDCMFWAACNLGSLGFLCSVEFTVPNSASFTLTIHLSISDLAVDSSISSTCMRVQIKASKTDPFHKGFFVYIGQAKASLCALLAMPAYLSMRGNVPGPLLLLSNRQPLSRPLLTNWLRQILSAAGINSNFSSHSFQIGAATVASPQRCP